MAGKTISQRISLEGAEDIRKKLEELGRVGAAAFDKLRESAKQGVIEPAQLDKARASFDRLADATGKSGDEFKNAAKAANDFGVRVGIISGVVSALTTKLISLGGQIRSALAPSELLKGTAETGKAIEEQAEKLKLSVTEWLALSKAIAAAGISEEKFIEGTKDLAKKLDEAKGGFAELTPGTLTSTSKGAVAAMRDLAEQINRVGNATQQAKEGTAAFGKNWAGIVNALTGAKAALKDTEDVFDKLAKVDRALSGDQAEKAADLAKAWDVLGKAIRAAKDQIGTVFLDSALLRAEWLIKLIDASRELFKTWQSLAEAKKKAFIEGLGDSPAEFLFKTLLAVGQNLASLWNNVLVPAGQKVVEIVRQLSGGFGEVSKSQVVGFLITAAAAALALSVALRAIALVMAPLTLLAALFTPLGLALVAAAAAAALFWDKIKAGAETVGRLIPRELEQMKAAIAKLFKGDFAGFWKDFSNAAVSAFQTIREAGEQGKFGETWKQIFLGVGQIIKDLPGAILLVAKAFIALGTIADGVAKTINAVFGTKLTGTDIAVIAIIGTMIGAFVTLAAIIGTVSSIILTLVGIFGGPVTAAILLAAAAAALFMSYWPQIKQAALDAGQAIQTKWQELKALFDAWVSTPVANAWQWLKDAFDSAVQWVTTKVDQTKQLIVDWVTTPVANAWQWLKDTFNDAISWIEEKFKAVKAAFGFGGGGGGGETPEGVGPIPGNARGGLFGGRGTGTSDSSNLAWVSRGEHIMPARAVRQPGVLAFLEALRRSGGNLGHVLDGMGRFASGGLVPRFAEGGLVGGIGHLGTVDLRTDHGTVRLMAGASAVDQLSRLAITKRMTSTGKKPGFIG